MVVGSIILVGSAVIVRKQVLIRPGSACTQPVPSRVHSGSLNVASVLAILVRKLRVHVPIVVLAIIVSALLRGIPLDADFLPIEVPLLLEVLLLLLQVIKAAPLVALVVVVSSRVHSGLHLVVAHWVAVLVPIEVALHVGQSRHIRVPLLVVGLSLIPVVVVLLLDLLIGSVVIKQFLHEL